MTLPRGRMTLRKGKFVLDEANMRLWDIEAPAGSTLAKLEQHSYLAALDAIDRFDAHKATATQSGQFTDAGLVADARQFALTTLTPTLHRGRQVIAAAKQEMAQRRAKLTPQPADKTDVAGQMRRLWMLDQLNKMPDERRRSYIAGSIESMDPELALAIMEMPPEFSGVLDADRKVLLDRALQAQHGEAITEVLELERGIVVAEHAVEAVRAEIARDVGVPDPHQWNQLAAPHERSATAPYLKKFVERPGVEVIRALHMNGGNGGTWAEATPEEIASGQYYASFADYQKARGNDAATGD